MRQINLNSVEDSSHALWGYESSKSIQRQIVDALCRGKRNTASTLLLDLGHGTPSLRVQDFVDVLNYCATSPDPLLKALGVEGMIKELMRYLRKAEHLFFRYNIELELARYNRVLDSLVSAKESRLAIKVFKHLKSSGLTLDAGTFDILIHGCAIIPCYKSACALLSMMLRSGFYPETVTYTGLIKITLEHGNFDDALNLLDKMSSEDIQFDRVLYNTILRTARWKGRIDIIELILGPMHRAKNRPDPSTCYYVFSAYVGRGFHNTAVEALQVLTMRMICQEATALQELKEKIEEDFIFNEDAEADLPILELFEE